MRPKGDRPDGGERRAEPSLVRTAKYAAFGLEFPGTIIGGLALGYAADYYLGTSPWFAVAATFTAFVAAVARLIQWVRRFGNEKR